MNHDNHNQHPPNTSNTSAITRFFLSILRRGRAARRSMNNSLNGRDNRHSNPPAPMPIDTHQTQNARPIHEEEDMPPLEPINNSRDSQDDSIPGLVSASDTSSDDDDRNSVMLDLQVGSDEEADYRDVEMNTIMEPTGFDDMPPLEPLEPRAAFSPTRTSTRRARVDDDEENDHMPAPPAAQLEANATPQQPPNATQGASGGRPGRLFPENDHARPHQHNPLFGASGMARPAFDVRSLFNLVFNAGAPRQPGNATPNANANANNDSNNNPPPLRNFASLAQGSGMTFTFNSDTTANIPNPHPHTHPHPPGHPPPGFVDITMGFFGGLPPIGGAHPTPNGTQVPGEGQQPQGLGGQTNPGPLPPIFEEMLRAMLGGNLAMPFSLGQTPEREDPERAKKLVAGLEVVPRGLARRLERVGGAPGAYEDESGTGGAGCAVCWDKLLDAEGDGFKAPDTDNSDDSTVNQDHVQAAPEDVGASDTTPVTLGQDNMADPPLLDIPEQSSSSSQPTSEGPKDSVAEEPTIVTLPCSHVFHASCLIPWFSRPGHTTCPTCRFNIDPDNLTYVFRPSPRTSTGPTPGNHGGANETATAPEPAEPEVDNATPSVAPNPSRQPSGGIENAVGGGAAPEQGRRGIGRWGAFAFIPGRGWSQIPNPTGPVDTPQDPLPQPDATSDDGADRAGVNPGSTAHTDGPAGRSAHLITLGFDFTFTAPLGMGREQGGDEEEDTARDQTLPQDMHDHTPNFLDELLGGRARQSDGATPAGGQTQPLRRKEWAPPAAPGLTLRQRVEKKEREFGLRCWDVSCGVGPTDDDPEPHSTASCKQVTIRSPGGAAEQVCEHTFHPACLVAAERVAGWGVDSDNVDAKPVEVACSVCRAVGNVDREVWDEGVLAMARGN